MWIFGYGSLMWKTNFNFEQSIVGFVRGYVRRFWQASEDHRGIPGNPGRVVTIISTNNTEDLVYGIAYKIPETNIAEVVEYLDYREKDGYEQRTVTFHPIDDAIEPFELKIYVADKNNPFYIGPAPLEDIAYQIFYSEGPSGRNEDYLLNLAEAMRTLVPDVYDDHLYQLEELVKKLKIKQTQISK